MGSKRNTGKKRRAPEKAGEHRKNEEFSKHRKKKELGYNTKKMWSSPREAGEIGENTGKRWRNTRKTWRAFINIFYKYIKNKYMVEKFRFIKYENKDKKIFGCR